MKSVFQSTEMDSLCQTYVTGFKLDQNHSGFTSSIYIWDRFVSFFNFHCFASVTNLLLDLWRQNEIQAIFNKSFICIFKLNYFEIIICQKLTREDPWLILI